MDKYNELTKEEKLEALRHIKHIYIIEDLEWGLCQFSWAMLHCKFISHDQHCFFKDLLNAKRKLQGYSFSNKGEKIISEEGYYWPVWDKKARIKWLDEQIKLVEKIKK